MSSNGDISSEMHFSEGAPSVISNEDHPAIVLNGDYSSEESGSEAMEVFGKYYLIITNTFY